MKKILILTQSPSSEQELQSFLQRLNSEVFCSSSLLLQLETCSEIIQHFSIVILSDTISNIEMAEKLSTLKNLGISILRIGNPKRLNGTEYAWMLDIIDDWIVSGSLSSDLVDKIAKLDLEKKQNVSNSPDTKDESNLFIAPAQQRFEHFILDLSKNEKKYLYELYKGTKDTENTEKEGYIARESLCQRIWNTDVSNSHLSQISAITKRIKNKLIEAGFGSEQLRTIWGRGYQLGSVVFNFLKINESLLEQ